MRGVTLSPHLNLPATPYSSSLYVLLLLVVCVAFHTSSSPSEQGTALVVWL